MLDAATQLLSPPDDPRARLRFLLEREFSAARVGLYGSGTQALTIALREASARLGSSPAVALPAFACFDVASAALGANSNVSFYDIDPDTLGPDMESLERVVDAGALVIVAASMYGVPVDWSAISTLASRYGAITIEDAAQGHGALWRGQRLGTLGDLAVLSFGRGKGWTGGGGGAVLARNGAEYDVEAIDANFPGETVTVMGLLAQWILARPQVYAIPLSIPALGLGETLYREPKPVTAITRVAAGALLSTHRAAAEEDEIRRANAAVLLEAIKKSPSVRSPHVHPADRAGYLRLPVRVPGGIDGLASPLRARELGIAPSYPKPLPEIAQISSRRVGPESSWPGADTLARELITLPTHSKLRAAELAEIVRLVCPRERTQLFKV